MFKTIFKFLISFIIILHCTGVTELVSSLSKDKSAFIGMLNTSEEETKKEKDNKEDISSAKNIQLKSLLLDLSNLLSEKYNYSSGPFNRIHHQFVIESPTPPPDFTA